MQVGLIGSGNMARALARGWGEPVLCSDGGSGRARELMNELGGEAFARGLAALERGGVRPAFQDAFDAVVGAAR
jgi:pyrroline-5-carboxylate reductase